MATKFSTMATKFSSALPVQRRSRGDYIFTLMNMQEFAAQNAIFREPGGV